MKNDNFAVYVSLCALALLGGAAALADEVKEKPPLYTYDAFWAIPRAHWSEIDKANVATQKVLEGAVAKGTIVGYGDDSVILHTADGMTHDNWFQGMSMSAVLNVLDEIYKAGGASSAVLVSATKHWDSFLISRYYNWKAGTYKGAYIQWSEYHLKPDSPNDAVDVMAKSFIVPLMEKLLADGAIVEYEIDVEAIHTEEPGTFTLFYIAQSAEGLDKVRAGLMEAVKKAPLAAPALASYVDFSKHRDALLRTTATYR